MGNKVTQEINRLTPCRQNSYTHTPAQPHTVMNNVENIYETFDGLKEPCRTIFWTLDSVD